MNAARTLQVTWNGSTFFVPESTAYAYEGGMGYPNTLEVRQPPPPFQDRLRRLDEWSNAVIHSN